MSNARKRADAALAELYAMVPEMADCKGLCHDSCGPIPMTTREQQRADIAGVAIPPVHVALTMRGDDEDWRCPALDADNRCSVYAVRPLICRLYGAVENMPCSHGCKPIGGYLTREQASELIRAAEQHSGGLAR